jgi:hypothetical protein
LYTCNNKREKGRQRGVRLTVDAATLENASVSHLCVGTGNRRSTPGVYTHIDQRPVLPAGIDSHRPPRLLNPRFDYRIFNRFPFACRIGTVLGQTRRDNTVRFRSNLVLPCKIRSWSKTRALPVFALTSLYHANNKVQVKNTVRFRFNLGLPCK